MTPKNEKGIHGSGCGLDEGLTENSPNDEEEDTHNVPHIIQGLTYSEEVLRDED